MTEELWVFGYGSLMWQPGFPHEEAIPARLIGGHRSLCVYSFVHRGTPEKPGLVLGLDAGGSCRGTAFRVQHGHEEATKTYLRAREQVTAVYKEEVRPVRLIRDGVQQVLALTYVVDRAHEQYAGVLPIERQARLVYEASGRSGVNIDYLINTVRHLAEAGVRDPNLCRVANLILRWSAASDSPQEASGSCTASGNRPA